MIIENKEKALELLQEMLDAGEEAILPLHMSIWHCGTACCLCGDVAIARNYHEDDDGGLSVGAEAFSDELDDELGRGLAESIYGSNDSMRLESVRELEFLNSEELEHEHLTINHHDRTIAHDYIKLIMKKIKEL